METPNPKKYHPMQDRVRIRKGPRRLDKAPEWWHLWRPPDKPAPVKHIMKDGKLLV